MSAVAIALAEMGHVVSGSDLREHPVLERVRAAGVDVHIGHDRALVHGVDAVTASTAIPARNIELDEARATGVTVLSRAGHARVDLRAGTVAGRRRHPRQDHDDLDADADPRSGRDAAELRRRRRRHRSRHRRAVDPRRLAGRRGRRERRHPSRAPAVRHRCSPTSRPIISTTTARSTASSTGSTTSSVRSRDRR